MGVGGQKVTPAEVTLWGTRIGGSHLLVNA